jgi:hypothetical protein
MNGAPNYQQLQGNDYIACLVLSLFYRRTKKKDVWIGGAVCKGGTPAMEQ